MTLNQVIYKVSKLFGSLQIARFLARNHPKILMYHRISTDGAQGTISIDQFRKQMKLINKSFNPISLSKLLEAHEQGLIPKHAVVVTFDDGYSDFAEYAFPILREEGVPATLFVTTGFVNGDIWLWPDQIRYAIQATNLESSVSIPGIPESLDVRHEPELCWHRIADYCMTIENSEKLILIKKLYKKLEVEFPKHPPDKYRAVSWHQLKFMVDEGLDVQSHSVTHPILSKVDKKSLQLELGLSKSQINDNLDIEVIGFCYPNGQVDDFNINVMNAVADAGYSYSVAAYPDKAPLNNIWSIKRYGVSGHYELFEKIVYGIIYLKM